MNTVLLTGAAGFIGSHLAEALVGQGARLRAFIRYNARSDIGLLRLLDPRLLKEIELVPGDLADPDAVHKAVRGCDTVFHLGALVSIPYSYHHPKQVVTTNVDGTLNVLLACRDSSIERLVHTSAGEVYGTPRALPITEDHPLQGQSPYAASKIAADKLAESFYCAYGLPVVIVRPFSAYGPRQSARAIIPTLITQALTRPEVHLGSPDTRRDFTFVTDIVSGFLKAAQMPGVEGHVYNLGSGGEVTAVQLLQAILTLTHAPGNGRPARESGAAARKSGAASSPEPALQRTRLLADTTRAREELAWRPAVPLEDGLRQTIAWISAHLDLYQPALAEF
jgi:nucleoside-diphosphate-sugar epimerase